MFYRAAFATLLILGLSAAITFKENGYEDVIISIHPDVPEDNANSIIDGIKAMVGSGSQKLFVATKGYAFIRSAIILLPTSWSGDYSDQTSSAYFYEDGALRVNLPNPLHLDTPYTIQLGGCGERGEYIHLTPDFLTHLNDSSTETFGPIDNIFVHEWAKLRYGVFEEYGYPGDDKFPLFYYEESYTNDGVVQELMPNFCTDVDLRGTREDIVNGGSCRFDPSTNLPDGNCVFIPSGDNSQIQTSMMAAPFLSSVTSFCEATEVELHHDRYKPTKHNFMCNLKPVWDVVMANSDFDQVKPMNSSSAPSTDFTVIQPDIGARFTLVLDRSGSMDDFSRWTRLVQSSSKWINYDLKKDSFLGITSFSDRATEHKQLTQVTDANRQSFVGVIEGIKTGGGTCLGDGLMQGMTTLNGADDSKSGGTIFFITDGKQECNNGLDITNAKIKERITRTKVRIVTVAFGKNSDPHLEMLAEISNGKTYFVKDDGGLDDINNVFGESNTYQPAVPSGDVEIVIIQKAFTNEKTIIEEFTIDATLGREVKMAFDKIGDVSSITVYHPNGTQLFTETKPASTVVKVFPFLEPGDYSYEIKASKPVEYVLVTISSKAASDQMLPFRTKCWASANGADVDPSKVFLAVYAEVMQGNRPVLSAKVEAFIERESEAAPIQLDLLDKGTGSDKIANDGVYSRYFTKFDNFNGRYTVRCQVKGDDSTSFITQKEGAKKVGAARSYPLNPSGGTAPVCCGSSTGANIDTEPTGNFTRSATGPSFKVVNAENAADLPPLRVTNLRIALEEEGEVITIEFTSTGENIDEGKADKYEMRYSQNITFLSDQALWNTSTLLSDNDFINGSLAPEEAGENVVIQLNATLFAPYEKYFIAIEAYDKKGQPSGVSNIVSLVKGDLIPPAAVRDLTIDEDLVVTFTATGDSNMVGKATTYELRYSNDPALLETKWNESSLITPDDIESGSLQPLEAGRKMTLTLNDDILGDDKYFALKAIDDVNRYGDLSNVVHVSNSGISGGAIAGIVIGCILLAFVVVATGYIVKKKVLKQ